VTDHAAICYYSNKAYFYPLFCTDILTTVNADVMSYGAKRTYEVLLAESNGLNENANYPLLSARLDAIGYKLAKVSVGES
jgi:hypothetical protein